jgi:hypothetical protein
VLLQIGPALECRDEVELQAVDRARAVRILTARLQAALAEVVDGPAQTSTVAPPRQRPFWSVPLALAGLLLDWLPFKIPGWISARITRTPDEAATNKLFLALMLFPAFWLAESLAAGLVAGWLAALSVAVLGPLGGLAALRVFARHGLVGARPGALRDPRRQPEP